MSAVDEEALLLGEECALDDSSSHSNADDMLDVQKDLVDCDDDDGGTSAHESCGRQDCTSSTSDDEAEAPPGKQIDATNSVNLSQSGRRHHRRQVRHTLKCAETATRVNNSLSTNTSTKRPRYSYATKLNYLLRDARFVMIKSNNYDNIDISMGQAVWSTPTANEARLCQAYHEARNVILIYSVRESGQFAGIARLASTARHDLPPVPWVLPPGMPIGALGGVFKVDWICKQPIHFEDAHNLFNAWNDNKLVKVGRDGTEIEPVCGKALCQLFAEDTTIDLTPVLRKSKQASQARRKLTEHERAALTPLDVPLDPIGVNFRPQGFNQQRHYHFPPLFSRKRRYDMQCAPYPVSSPPSSLTHRRQREYYDQCCATAPASYYGVGGKMTHRPAFLYHSRPMSMSTEEMYYGQSSRIDAELGYDEMREDRERRRAFASSVSSRPSVRQ